MGSIIKHLKNEYVDLISEDDDGDRNDLHHDFNQSSASRSKRMVSDIRDYILKVCSPLQGDALKNILTGEVTQSVDVDKLISCVEVGKLAYDT